MSEPIVGHRIGIGLRVGVVYLGDICRNDAAFGSDRDSEPDGDRVGRLSINDLAGAFPRAWANESFSWMPVSRIDFSRGVSRCCAYCF